MHCKGRAALGQLVCTCTLEPPEPATRTQSLDVEGGGSAPDHSKFPQNENDVVRNSARFLVNSLFPHFSDVRFAVLCAVLFA